MNSIGPLGQDGGTRGTFIFDTIAWTGIEGVTNTGHPMATFLLGLPRQKTRLVGDFQLNYWLREWGVFFQDDYKVTRNLTLNIGVRYMYYTPPYDSRNAISSWIQPQECPSYSVCGPNYLNLPADSPYQAYYGLAGEDLPRSLAPTDKKNIGPRFGFAWQPFGSSTTVIRGGYGIFYDTVPVSLNGDTLLNYPQVIEDQENVASGPEWFAGSECADRFSDQQAGVGRRRSRVGGAVHAWTQQLQPELQESLHTVLELRASSASCPGSMVVEVAYAGTKGTRLHRQIVLNLAEPLGPLAVVPDLTNNPNIRSDIGDSAQSDAAAGAGNDRAGSHHTPGQRLRRTVHGVFELPRRHAAD